MTKKPRFADQNTQRKGEVMVKLDEIIEATDLAGKVRLGNLWNTQRGFDAWMTMPNLAMRYIERLEEQVKPIVWTSTKPTKPGMWWWRPTGFYQKGIAVEIVEICGYLEVCEDWWDTDCTDLHGEWSSEPIPEPQEDTSCGTSSFSAPASSPTKS